MRNHDVCRLSFGPKLVPTTYLMTLPVSATSGSAPSLPTSVIRASCDGRVVENARAEKLGTLEVMRLAGERRNDMFLVWVDVAGNSVCGMCKVDVRRTVLSNPLERQR